MTKRVHSTLAILVAGLALSMSLACAGPDAPGAAGNAERVEILLPQGDADNGERLFVNLACTSCHLVSGVEGLPQPVNLDAAVDLAESARGLSRSAIVTSIIVPTHVDSRTNELWADWEGEQRVWLGPGQRETEEEEASAPTVSLMTSYAAVMTVAQLADLVAFVESVASQ